MRICAIVVAASCVALALPANAQDRESRTPVRIVARDAAQASPPIPATDPGTWVTTEDYPAWAVRYEVTGRVRVDLEVDRDGRVTSCEVSESSGVADLDVLACEKISERGRFVPAHDADGDPTAGHWASTVVWKMPDELHAPPQPGSLVVTAIVERDGSISNCQVERVEGQAAEVADRVCKDLGAFEPVLDEDGIPKRVRIRIMSRVAHEPVPQ
jgi:periplasmic protein TonB